MPGKIVMAAAGAALFAAGYMGGCAGAQHDDYRIFSKDEAGKEHVYLQDKKNTTDLYEIIKTDHGLELKEYSADIRIRNATQEVKPPESNKGQNAAQQPAQSLDDSL